MSQLDLMHGGGEKPSVLKRWGARILRAASYIIVAWFVLTSAMGGLQQSCRSYVRVTAILTGNDDTGKCDAPSGIRLIDYGARGVLGL